MFCDIYLSKRCSSGLEAGKERISIINTILFQKYHVLSLLGSGSSSSVYLAEHLKLNQYRAIKCIPKAQTRSASGYLEANLMKNLRHPGIPMIYDTEEDEQYVYIVEEYIQGESLSAFVQNQNNISQETVVSIGIQLCEILEYLHSQKPNPILYLDLKPEHIILCGKQLKLLDFGIATTLTNGGNVFQGCGTRGFAAPEQFTGHGVGEQADVFGIGAILYYMLTGDILPPFLKASITFPKYCSAVFKKIILKAVAPRLNTRYEQVRQLREELEKLSSCRNGNQSAMHLLKKIIVTGSQKRIGTTHVAVGLVTWLNSQGRYAYYQEKGDQKLLPALLSYKEGVTGENGICQYQDFRGLCAPTTSNQIRGLYAPATPNLSRKPCIAVWDYGADVMSVAEEEADLVILVVGSRPWELEQAIGAYEKLSGEENLAILCNYNHKQIAGKYAGIFQRKIYLFPFDAEPFAITKEKRRLFQQILEERR